MKKIFLSFLLSLFFIQQVNACGIFLSEEGTNVRADHMNVILSYDESNNKEDLIVNMDYLVNQGEVSNFGWLMPFPSKPSIDDYQKDIFQIVEKETAPKKNLLERLNERLNNFAFGRGVSKGVSKGMINDGIEVIEEKKVGVFDVSVIKAKNTNDLMKWTNTNKYHISWLKSGMLEEYIEKDWYFVLMKLNKNESFGDIHPVRFSFDTEKPIYPIELTRYDRTGKYNSEKTVPITLYLIGINKMKPNNYQMEYIYGGEMSEDTKNAFPFLHKDAKMITKWSATLLGEHIKEDITVSEKADLENINDGSMTKAEKNKLPILIPLLPFFLIYKLMLANILNAIVVLFLLLIPMFIAIKLNKNIIKRTLLFVFFTYLFFSLISSIVVFPILPTYILGVILIIIMLLFYFYRKK